MIICPNCKSKIQDDFVICPYCGHQLYGKKKTNKLVWAIVIGIIVAVLILAVGRVMLASYVRQNYMDSVQNCGAKMNQGMNQAVDAYNITVSVWHNAIFGTDDPDTDRFTKDENGEFYDFNDALHKVYADESFNKRLNLLYTNREDVEDMMRELNNPPNGCEQIHNDILDVYQKYDILVDAVLNPQGSYDSYTEKFHETKEDGYERLKRLSMYF